MLSKLTWQGVVVFGLVLAASVALAFLNMPKAVEGLIAFVTGATALGTILFKKDDDDPPPPPPPRSPTSILSRGLSVLVVVACFARLITACGSAPKPAEYGAELALCSETNSTCETYVACRAKVAAKYGREFHGSCKDGGAP